MGIQAVGHVLEHSDAQGADRLVMIAIANHAGALTDDGYYDAYPGIELIADEANLDRLRTAKDAITRLVKAGEIERVINGAPDERIPLNRRPNLYRIPTEPRPVDAQIGYRFPAEVAHRHPVFGRPAAAVGVSSGGTPTQAPDHLAVPVDNNPVGVPSRDTPTVHRGVVSRRTGVSDSDAQGCRDATPKPSMNRHRTRGADDSRANTPAEPDVDNPAEAFGAEARRDRIADACQLLAHRRAARRSEPVGDGWITNTARGLAERHASAGHRLLFEQPGLSPTELAELLEPSPERLEAEVAQRVRLADEATALRARNLLAGSADPYARRAAGHQERPA